MKKAFRFILTLCVSLGLFSCFGDTTPVAPNSIFTKYPLTEGNIWNYHRLIRFHNINPDSLSNRFPDTLFSNHVLVESLGKTKLLGLFETYVLVERMSDSVTINPPDVGRSYYANEEDGLYLKGYSGTGLSMPKNSTRSLKFKNIYYRDITHLLAQLNVHRINPVGSSPDSLYLEIPPKKVLEYPLHVGSSWIYREPGDPFIIGKKIKSQGIISITAGKFLVFQMVWMYDLDGDGQWDDDIIIVDDYARIGLVRRSITITDIIITDEWLNEIGTYDYSELTELVSYQVNN
jgi:hypothetical protein